MTDVRIHGKDYTELEKCSLNVVENVLEQLTDEVKRYEIQINRYATPALAKIGKARLDELNANRKRVSDIANKKKLNKSKQIKK